MAVTLKQETDAGTAQPSRGRLIHERRKYSTRKQLNKLAARSEAISRGKRIFSF